MRLSFRWPLRYQILVPFALVLLGAILTVSVLNAVLATQRSQQQIEQQLKGIAATLADSTFPLTDEVLRQMRGLSGAEFVLTDRQGQALAASGSVEVPPLSPLVVSQWQDLRLGPRVVIGGEPFFSMVLAMNGRGLQPAGRLHIFYPERSWQEARNEAVVSPLVVGAIGLATTALLALLLAGRLTRPIFDLRQQVDRIAQADYAPVPLPERDDELRDLAVAVNRLAEHLSEMDRAIRRSERLALLGQLAGGLAHHLRNNVTGALMAMQLHARECNTDRESLTVAVRQLTRLEENLKQFLGAPQSPQEVATRAEVRLSDVVQEAVELVQPSLRHRHVRLTVVERFGPDTPIANSSAADGDDRHHALLADAGQLRQLLVNLVLNGADAAGPNGWVEIATGLSITGAEGAAENQQSPPHIVLRVSDSGPGPAPEIAARLFEPFVTNKPEGIGLGLAVSQQIAESHGGSIFFNRQNGDTCVEVHLPLAPNSSKTVVATRERPC